MHPRLTGRASGRHITHNARISDLTATGNEEIGTRLDKAQRLQVVATNSGSSCLFRSEQRKS